MWKSCLFKFSSLHMLEKNRIRFLGCYFSMIRKLRLSLIGEQEKLHECHSSYLRQVAVVYL
jgi:hypothetical protein